MRTDRHEARRRRPGSRSSTLGLVSLSTLTVDSHYWPDVILAHDAHGQRHGAHDGAGDRVDHGLAAARQGGRRLGGERHHPPGRWRAGRRGHRQRAVVDLRVEDRRLPRRHADPGAPPRPGIKESLGAALGVAGKLAKTAPDVAAALTHAANTAFVDGMQIGVLVAAGADARSARSSRSSGCRLAPAARTSRRRTPRTPNTGRRRRRRARRAAPRSTGRRVAAPVEA